MAAAAWRAHTKTDFVILRGHWSVKCALLLSHGDGITSQQQAFVSKSKQTVFNNSQRSVIMTEGSAI